MKEGEGKKKEKNYHYRRRKIIKAKMNCSYFVLQQQTNAKKKSNTSNQVLVIADSLLKVHKNILGKIENSYELGMPGKYTDTHKSKQKGVGKMK